MTLTQIGHRNRASQPQTPLAPLKNPNKTNSARILIVDAEESLRDLLAASLERSGYEVLTTSSGEEAFALFAQQQVDLVLLDAILPTMDGFTVCSELRRQSDVPIVILTALNRPDDIVRGFDMGADDYILKPFTFREVEARLQAILRRVAWIEEQPAFRVVAFGDIILNDDEKRVIVHGKEVDLTPIEYQLLYQLMHSPNQPVSKDDLFKTVWGCEDASGTNLVEVAIRRLREKVERNPSKPAYLVTVRGVGYKFDAQYARSQQEHAQNEEARLEPGLRMVMAA